MSDNAINTPRQVGIYVRAKREAEGLTRAELAEASGVSERLVASLELGSATGIRLDKLLAVLHALDLGLCVTGDVPEEVGTPSRATTARSRSAVTKKGSARRAPHRAKSSQFDFNTFMLSTSEYDKALSDFLGLGSLKAGE